MLFEGKRAIGVEYAQNGVMHGCGRGARCCWRRLAINRRNCCSCRGSARARCCSQFGIDVVHELPGVGENLQDHLGGRIIYRRATANTMNEISRSWLRRL